MSDELFSQGEAALAAQPFSVLLGARLRALTPGQAELELAIRPEFAQQLGFVHGGVISYLADNALACAGASVLGLDVLTAEYKVSYVRPGQGDRLIARASVVGASGRQAVCRCDVFGERDGQEYLCATALGTIVRR
jgi:uncharacterized protein (TIGR00369 family)